MFDGELLCSAKCGNKLVGLLESDFLGMSMRQWIEQRIEEKIANKSW